MKITISGDIDTIKTLQYLSEQFKEPAEPLRHSSKRYLLDIATNFKDTGKTFGQSWAPLKPTTIAIKKKLFKEGKAKAIYKILVRTGEMQKSFDFDMPDNNTARIYNEMDYSTLHQEGGTSNLNGRTVKVPKRILAAVDTARIEMVGTIFTNWINMLIKSKNAQ